MGLDRRLAKAAPKGLSALAVCRPTPFAVDKAPGVSDVAPFLFSGKEE